MPRERGSRVEITMPFTSGRALPLGVVETGLEAELLQPRARRDGSDWLPNQHPIDTCSCGSKRPRNGRGLYPMPDG